MDLRDLKDRYGTKERTQLSSGHLRAVSSLTEWEGGRSAWREDAFRLGSLCGF